MKMNEDLRLHREAEAFMGLADKAKSAADRPRTREVAAQSGRVRSAGVRSPAPRPSEDPGYHSGEQRGPVSKGWRARSGDWTCRAIPGQDAVGEPWRLDLQRWSRRCGPRSRPVPQSSARAVAARHLCHSVTRPGPLGYDPGHDSIGRSDDGEWPGDGVQRAGSGRDAPLRFGWRMPMWDPAGTPATSWLPAVRGQPGSPARQVRLRLAVRPFRAGHPLDAPRA